MAQSKFESRLASSAVLRHSFAIAAVAIALAMSLFFQEPDVRNVRLLFLLAVAVSAWYAGRVATVIALVLSIGLIDYFFIEPRYSLSVNASEIPYFAFFVGFALLVAWFSFVRRRVERDLLAARDELEIEVTARTQQASLLNLTHDTIFVRDMSDLITYWNRGAEQQYGWTAAEAIGKRSHDLLSTVFPASIDQINAELLNAGRWEGELRHTKANGIEMLVLSRWSLQRDELGRPAAILETNNDITERKRAEERLRDSETRFRTFVDQATDALFVLEFDGGTILEVNRRACENLGYKREELIGHSIFLFDVNFSAEWLEQNVRPAMEAGETMIFETRHRRKEGTIFPVEIRARTFQYQGRVLNLSLALDITERKRVEEERERLRQLEADLAHINRVSMMGELSASIAHEVNQPLSGIVTNASACLRWLAGDASDLDEVREAISDIVRDGKRAGEVIARVRAMTRRTTASTEKLDLNETIRGVLAFMGAEAKKNSVTIRTSFADDLSSVSGDRVQLQQVALNLLMNAIEAMGIVDERQRQLLITTRNIDPEQVQATVTDTGIGLDPNRTSRIFEPFYTTKSGGMGMGLSICRSIVENHGGRLWAAANQGPGTSFHFTLLKYGEAHARVTGV
jgi:PAS domain S-box-containing protein